MVSLQQILAKRTTHSPIGLDLGQAAVRVAQLRRVRQHWHVHRLGSWQRPASARSESGGKFGSRRMASWLNHLELRGKTTIVGLSTPDIEVHALELPPAVTSQSDAQWRQMADVEIKRLSRGHGGDLQSDVWRLPEQRRTGPTAIGVAARRPVVEQANNLCRSARLDCSAVDATACALARFGRAWLDPVDSQTVWGLLDLGERMSRLVVCALGTPVLVRSFEYGGGAWTQRLGEALGVSTEAALRHKHDHGITRLARQRSGPESPAVGHGVIGEMIFNVLRSDLDAMLGEIERSYRYAMQCFPGISLGPLLLVGCGAQMRNLTDLVADQLGIRVIVPSPETAGQHASLCTDNLPLPGRDPLCAFAAAIGLALPEEDVDGSG